MDIDVVMLLIGLAIFIWSFISKMKKRKKAAPRSVSRWELISKITERIRQSVAELEKRAAAAPKGSANVREVPDPWAVLTGSGSSPQAPRGDDGGSPAVPPQWEIEVAEERSEVLRQAKPPTSVPPAPPIAVPSEPVVFPVAPQEPTPVPVSGVLEVSPHNLRSAVIWSEILAPPLALRKDDF